jgi:hypothetical protein
MPLIPVQWYQLAYGHVPAFSSSGKFVTFAEHLHITLWAGGTGMNPVIQEFEATENQNLGQMVHRYLESAARRVSHMFHGTLHAVIYSIGSDIKHPVRNELNEVVEFVNGEYTTMGLGLAYAQTEVVAKFQYMSVSDLGIKLPTEVDSEQGRKVVSRYNRPRVI